MLARWPLTLLTLVGLAPCLGAQGDLKPLEGYEGIRWVPSYKAALEEGKGRGCPVLVVITNKSGHENTTKAILGDKAVIRLSREFVCVVSHDDYSHTPKPRKGERRYRGPCPLYGTIRCADHVKAWPEISARFVRMSVVQQIDIPQHIYVDPTRDEELFRRLDGLTKREMLYDMNRALKLVGKGLRTKVYRSMRAALDRALKLLNKGQYRPAAAALDAFLSFKKRHAKVHTSLIAEGNQLVQELERKGEGMIREALDLEKEKRLSRARHLLERVEREFKPFPVADRARKELRAMRRRAARADGGGR